MLKILFGVAWKHLDLSDRLAEGCVPFVAAPVPFEPRRAKKLRPEFGA